MFLHAASQGRAAHVPRWSARWSCAGQGKQTRSSEAQEGSRAQGEGLIRTSFDKRTKRVPVIWQWLPVIWQWLPQNFRFAPSQPLSFQDISISLERLQTKDRL